MASNPFEVREEIKKLQEAKSLLKDEIRSLQNENGSKLETLAKNQVFLSLKIYETHSNS